jgi:hypothetical protein
MEGPLWMSNDERLSDRHGRRADLPLGTIGRGYRTMLSYDRTTGASFAA